jgi:microcystin-dependent protein
MSEPFVGEIRMFAGNFAPRGWAYCDGQLLAISQNDALFSLLGTIYGGDGRTTFGLPDLRGRIPIHAGSGPGLSPRSLGAKGGAENVTVTVNELPAHSHTLRVSTAAGTGSAPSNEFLGASPNVRVFRPQDPNVNLDAASITSVGGSRPHDNVMPFLCVHFIIALFGIYPSRH